jgi:hypothetical protein
MIISDEGFCFCWDGIQKRESNFCSLEKRNKRRKDLPLFPIFFPYFPQSIKKGKNICQKG